MCRSALVLFLALVAAGCGSSGDGISTSAEVSLVLTDAASDELSAFEVDVQNIVFTRPNGDTAAVLPHTTRIDFLQLQSFSELVAGITLPAGSYSQVTMLLDFSAASVVIAGQTTPATVRDAAGNVLTGSVPVTIDFPSAERPLVRLGRHSLWVLDLQLDQSVAVDSGNNEVTFTPVWTVEVDPSNPKPIAANGVLQSVDLNARTFVVERRAPDDSAIGDFTVSVANTTVFQQAGVVDTGASGLGALVAQIGNRVFVQGTLNTQDRVLAAVAVEAGAGVPGNGQDWVLGHVVARTGGAGADATLTVLGRSLDLPAGTSRWNTLHTVNLSHANTKVLRRGAGNGLDSDAINVGQLVWVFGDLASTTLDATAATGVARLLRTSIYGVAAGVPASNTLTLDVARFDLRDVSAFDFDVSGNVQADPNALTVDITGLSPSGITSGTKVRVLGWLGGVGAAGADATAEALVNHSTTGSVMLCQWSPARLAVLDGFQSMLSVDVSAAQIRDVADVFGSTFLTASPTPAIAPRTTLGLYSIVQDGAIETNLSFPNFLTAVLARSASAPVFRVVALGTLDETTQVFSAAAVTVVLD